MKREKIKRYLKIFFSLFFLFAWTIFAFVCGYIEAEDDAVNKYLFLQAIDTEKAFANYDDPQKNRDGSATKIIEVVCENDPSELICDALSHYYSEKGFHCVATEWQLGSIHNFRKTLKIKGHKSDEEIAKNKFLKVKTELYEKYLGLCQSEKPVLK